MPTGAIALLDDYGWSPYYAQKKILDEFASGKGVEIFMFPTGQGLLISLTRSLYMVLDWAATVPSSERRSRFRDFETFWRWHEALVATGDSGTTGRCHPLRKATVQT